jgi:hypothetical protein
MLRLAVNNTQKTAQGLAPLQLAENEFRSVYTPFAHSYILTPSSGTPLHELHHDGFQAERDFLRIHSSDEVLDECRLAQHHGWVDGDRRDTRNRLPSISRGAVLCTPTEVAVSIQSILKQKNGNTPALCPANRAFFYLFFNFFYFFWREIIFF